MHGRFSWLLGVQEEMELVSPTHVLTIYKGLMETVGRKPVLKTVLEPANKHKSR